MFIPVIFAHESGFEEDYNAPEKILKLCHFFYEEYMLIGSENFKDHHKLFLNARICPVLYESIAWNSQHPQKDTVLIFEIREKLGENANYLKEKHVGEPSSIPKWFKNKANLWMGWEIKDQEFLKAAAKYADLNLIDKSGQKSIPDWFKQTTKWYLDETISEKEFMSSIKYMVKSH
ncbi:MAG: hypothetical protein OPY05_00085 [Nitrosopumilus sp.]|nr:hypothetical protein [Nitrosopumilus sp.]